MSEPENEYAEGYREGFIAGKQKAKEYIIGALERAYPSTIWARTEHVIKLIQDLDL